MFNARGVHFIKIKARGFKLGDILLILRIEFYSKYFSS